MPYIFFFFVKTIKLQIIYFILINNQIHQKLNTKNW